MSINKRFIEEADRIKRNDSKLTLSKIAEGLGVSRQYFSQINTEKAKPSLDIVNKFEKNFGIDATYILTGKRTETTPGDLNIKDRHIKLRQSLKDKELMVYETNTLAAAGSVEIINDEPNMIFDTIRYGELNDVIGTVKASGNSMYPTLPNGCNVAVKRLMDKTLIAPGKLYLLIDSNNSPFVKRLYEFEGGVILKSDNKSSDEDGSRQYPDFKRKWNQILAIYEVKAVINLL